MKQAEVTASKTYAEANTSNEHVEFEKMLVQISSVF